MKKNQISTAPRRGCIFCGRTPLTKEHVHPAWMRDYLPHKNRTNHLTVLNDRDVHSGKYLPPSISEGVLNRSGDHRSRKLRVVCESCNSGWMSKLQTSVKPILAPFLEGATIVVTERECRKLAIWAAMYVMVYEFADLKTVGISKEQREFLKANGAMPSNWCVWIGKFVDRIGSTPTWHRGLSVSQDKEHAAYRVGNQMNTHISVFGMGGIVFMTFSTCEDGIFASVEGGLNAIAQSIGFSKIFPPITGPVSVDGMHNRPIVSDKFEIIIRSMCSVFS